MCKAGQQDPVSDPAGAGAMYGRDMYTMMGKGPPMRGLLRGFENRGKAKM